MIVCETIKMTGAEYLEMEIDAEEMQEYFDGKVTVKERLFRYRYKPVINHRVDNSIDQGLRYGN